MKLQEGTTILLTTGETFVLDNEMKTSKSCTIWDMYRFREDGILKGVNHMGIFFEPVENPIIRDSLWYRFERFEPKPIGECAGCKEEIIEGEEIIEVLEFNEKVILHEDANCCKAFLAEIGICKYAGEE